MLCQTRPDRVGREALPRTPDIDDPNLPMAASLAAKEGLRANRAAAALGGSLGTWGPIQPSRHTVH